MTKHVELIATLDCLIEKYGEKIFKDAVKTINRRRVNKNRQNRISFPWKEYVRLYKSQRGICPICEQPMILLKTNHNLAIDHIDPNREDFNAVDNRQLTHDVPCNRSKGSKGLFAQSKAYGKTITEIIGGGT